MAERKTRPRGPYTGGNRITAWRLDENKKGVSDCTCEYHDSGSCSSSCDPDENGDPDNSSSSDSDPGDENFSFDNHLLDRLFINAENRTAREVVTSSN